MERSYYFSINAQQVGPLDEEGIRQQLAKGAITAETLAWCEGMSGWEPAGQLEELKLFFIKSRPAAQPPPLPESEKPASGPVHDDLNKTEKPEGLSSLEETAYRFVLGFYRTWGGFSPPVRNYVLKNPKRAVPVALVTIGLILAVVVSLPSMFQQTSEQAPVDGQQQTQISGQQQMPTQGVPPNWQQNYQILRDTQNYNQGVIDDVYKYRQKAEDRMDETYRRGTYDWYNKNND